jgi:phosphoserine aminotransferase
METQRVYNFAAGPSQLPLPVLERAQKELLNYHNSGMSVMEMSHRSSIFQSIFEHTDNTFRQVMNVPDDYDVLYLQGGGWTQFAMVPMNMIGKNSTADYAITGNFSNKAYEEARRYGAVRVAYSGKGNSFTHIPRQGEIVVDPDASYFHYCANNTIYGTEWDYVPETGDVPLVADMSSDITSREVDISKYALIYAGAQKNMAPAGVTVVILKKDFDFQPLPATPTMLRYKTHIDKNSMFNTPPCWQIYMLGLQMDWIIEQGGVKEMERRAVERSSLLYDTLEKTSIFHLHAEKESRSRMNVTFRTGDEELDKEFVAEAAEQGMVNLAGHRLTKGMRASIYNAMPLEGVKKLCGFIETFDAEHRKG